MNKGNGIQSMRLVCSLITPVSAVARLLSQHWPRAGPTAASVINRQLVDKDFLQAYNFPNGVQLANIIDDR